MRREILFLREMLDAALRIQELAAHDGDSGDATLRAEALRWNFTVLGEAAARLPSEFSSLHSEVEWAKPVRMRNRIVHGYWSIDDDVLIDTAVIDLPDLIDHIRQIIDSFD